MTTGEVRVRTEEEKLNWILSFCYLVVVYSSIQSSLINASLARERRIFFPLFLWKVRTTTILHSMNPLLNIKNYRNRFVPMLYRRMVFSSLWSGGGGGGGGFLRKVPGWLLAEKKVSPCFFASLTKWRDKVSQPLFSSSWKIGFGLCCLSILLLLFYYSSKVPWPGQIVVVSLWDYIQRRLLLT